MTIDDMKNITPGLYRVKWKSGSEHLAVVGGHASGRLWFAQINFDSSHGLEAYLKNIEKMVRIEVPESSSQPNPIPLTVVEECSTCKYWECDDDSDDTGFCRRYPPSREIPAKLNEYGKSIWCAITTFGSSCCGEWKQKQPTPATEST